MSTVALSDREVFLLLTSLAAQIERHQQTLARLVNGPPVLTSMSAVVMVEISELRELMEQISTTFPRKGDVQKRLS